MWINEIFPDAIATWTALGAIATFFAVIIALFGEKIKSKIWGAKITINHENKLPYNKIAFFEDKGIKHKGFYLRLKIENTGSATVHGVYGKLTKIEYEKDNKVIEIYDPSVLRWVGSQKCEPLNLSPRDYDFLDVLFTVENSENFFIQTDYVLRGSPFVFKRDLNPHLLYISIYSDDAPTKSMKYRLEFNNELIFDSATLTLVNN